MISLVEAKPEPTTSLVELIHSTSEPTQMTSAIEHCIETPSNYHEEFKRHCTKYPQNTKLSNKEGNQYIIDRIKEGCPFVIGRLSMGSELGFVSQLLAGRPLDNYYGADQAGFYPKTPEGLLESAKIYYRSVESLNAPYDAAASFGMYDDDDWWYCLNPKLTHLGSRSLEPFYFMENPWSKYLDGKTVLIVAHFIETIRCQLRVREKLYPGTSLLPPGVKFKFVRTFQTSMASKLPHNSYGETINATLDIIDAQEPYDIALISAGAYGMPFAQHIRKNGHSAIYIGGGLQIMFGIKGNRWLGHNVINKFFNKHWIYPLKVDTPDWHMTFEDSAYWAKNPKDTLSECPWPET